MESRFLVVPRNERAREILELCFVGDRESGIKEFSFPFGVWNPRDFSFLRLKDKVDYCIIELRPKKEVRVKAKKK